VTSGRGKSPAHSTPADTSSAVGEFMARLDHPCQAEIAALRELVLGVDPAIAEGIKWNAPSFRTGEHFATMHLRAKTGVALILHRGAKARALPAGGLAIDDPEKLLRWLGEDRAMIELRSAEQLPAQRAALADVIRQWIRYV